MEQNLQFVMSFFSERENIQLREQLKIKNAQYNRLLRKYDKALKRANMYRQEVKRLERAQG